MTERLRLHIQTKQAKLAVIGLGYVGLPVACSFADAGFEVTGVDILPERIRQINAGRSPIGGDEPGLAELLAGVVASAKLHATAEYEELRDADIILINVETPVGDDHKPKYKALRSACRSLGKVLKKGALVIVESTIAPGTMAKVVQPALESSSGLVVNEDFNLGHCPERVMPGKLLANIAGVSRVCGGSSQETAETMVQLYRHVVDAELDAVDLITAELVKTMENAYRDVQIAFANEMAVLCEGLGADVWQVRELVNKSPGRHMLLPGAGVGGHCIPKDGWLLIAKAPRNFKAQIVPAAREVNDAMPKHILDLLTSALAEFHVALSEADIAVFGYAYLQDSDDTRNSPSAILVDLLRTAGARVAIHDPVVWDYAVDWQAVAIDADAAIFMVAHSDYHDMDLRALHKALRLPILVDGRHIFPVGKLTSAGFVSRIIGVGGDPSSTGENNPSGSKNLRVSHESTKA